MSLYFVCGKVGAGKSYRGVVRIYEQLLQDDRLIVTNLKLNLSELSELLALRHPDRDIPLFDHSRPVLKGETPQWSENGIGMVFVSSRIRILEDDELAEFYRYRQVDTPLVTRFARNKDKNKVRAEGYDRNPVLLDFSPWSKGGVYEGRGVIYHLDELQLFYNCRKFSESPEEMPFYLSQHRKLGDDIYAYTQQPSNVDKMFRSFTQEFIYITNIGKRRLMGFRMPSFFRFAGYPDVLTGQHQTAEFSGYFRMDMELAKCYNTAGGVGIEAARADTQEKRPGRPWQVLVGALVVSCILIALIPFFFGRLGKVIANKHLSLSHFAKTVAGVTNDPSAVLPKTNDVHPASGSQLPVTVVPPVNVLSPAAVGGVTGGHIVIGPGVSKTSAPDNLLNLDNETFLVGWSLNGVVPCVFLSDGRRVTEAEGLEELAKTYCVIHGRIYHFQSTEERVSRSHAIGTKVHDTFNEFRGQ